MKNFKEPENCDPVLLCTSTDMETIWVYSVTTEQMSKILDISGGMFCNKQLNASSI